MLYIKDIENDYSRPTKFVVVTIVFVVIIVLSGVFYVFFLDKNKNVTESNEQQVLGMTLEQQLLELNKRSRLSIPSIESEKSISSKNLPLQIVNLIGPEAIYNSVKSIVYDNGSIGFEIELSYSKPTSDAYFSFMRNLKNEKWSILYGSRYEDSGIIDIENNSYTAIVLFSKLIELETGVKIFIVNKKIQ